MSEVKKVRLSKAAKEFNVSMATIVDFLSAKGVAVESNPNAALDPAAYDLLSKEYATDKNAKEKAEQLNIVRAVSKETAAAEKAQAEDKAQAEKVVAEESIAVEKPVATPVEVVAKVEEKPEPKEVEAVVEKAPVAEKEVEKVEVKEVKTEVTPTKSDSIVGPKVLGKIDLGETNKKSKKAAAKAPEKKAEKPAEKVEKKQPEVKVEKAPEKKETPKVEKAPEKPKEEPKVQPKEESKTEVKEEPKPVKEDPKVEPVVEKKAPVEEGPKEPEMIRGTVETLSGPKILGKIVLNPSLEKKADYSEFKKKNKTAGTSDANAQKKKRQRIQTDNKVDINKEKVFDNNRPNTGNTNNNNNNNNNRNKKRPVRNEKVELSEEEIQKQIKETLQRLGDRKKNLGTKLRKDKRMERSLRREEEEREIEKQSKVLKVTEFVSANDLANLMDVPVTSIISACMSLGMFVSINQRLDAEAITIIAEEFGFKVEFVSADANDELEEEVDDPKDLLPRPPVVTVMGHVDHGKTSLLDKIRNANVIAGEAGGITQHIGAYSVKQEDGKMITFIDTPGHEAFTAMRARGAKVTDVAIIVIAADDSVMPQTIEAINHAQAAGVPMVFAFNKIDKPGANPDKIREALANMNLLVEEWGGKYQTQEISAKQNIGIKELLDKVLLEAEMLDLRSNPNKRGSGTVIEASLDKGRGFVCTILVQNGSIEVGDVILAGPYSGRIKAMFNERGTKVNKAGPSTPVRILGLSGAPQAGDLFTILEDEREARDIANKRTQLLREQGMRTRKHITLDEIGRRIAIGDFKQLNIIIKGDTDGSVQALTDSLLKLSTEQIMVNVIHQAVGAISESDVMLASASDAIILGFNVRPVAGAKKLADKEEIDIRGYSVIYKAIEEIKDAMEGLLEPTLVEKVTANIEIRAVFKITKVGTIAGCYVLDGKVERKNKVRVIRDGIVIHTGELDSLKRFKDDVKEVNAGYECGLSLKNFNDIQELDILETFEEVEVKRKL